MPARSLTCLLFVFVLLALCTACGASAQVPPMLEEYKEAEWQPGGNIIYWWNEEGDTLRIYDGGGRAEGVIDGKTVAGCRWIGLFAVDTLGVLGEATIQTASGYGEDGPLQSHVHCVQLTASIKDSTSAE